MVAPAAQRPGQADSRRWRVDSEDFDAAPSVEISHPDTPKRISCLHVDDATGILWAGVVGLRPSPLRVFAQGFTCPTAPGALMVDSTAGRGGW
jgi:hypothetical protein